jgi:hypothetical protein
MPPVRALLAPESPDGSGMLWTLAEMELHAGHQRRHGAASADLTKIHRGAAW